jgi:putative endonuclease
MTQDLQKRLSHHNSGKVKSTKFYKPFKIVYLKQFQTRDLARDHEKYLKIRSNKERIIKTLS